jgi:transcriptional regulator with XRE-family HTH domain
MNRIKLLREEMGWTQEYLGSLLNLKNAAISKYETGRAALTEDTLRSLSQLFKVSSDYLIGLSDIRDYSPHDISSDEKRILSYFNKLDDEHQDIAKGYLATLYIEQQKSENYKYTSPSNTNESNKIETDDDILRELDSYRAELLSKRNNKNTIDQKDVGDIENKPQTS